MSALDMADRARGTLLGTAVGEALESAGDGDALHPAPATTAMLALADSLVRLGDLDDAHLADIPPAAPIAGAPAWIAPLAIRFVHDYVAPYGRAQRVVRLTSAPALEADATLVQVAALAGARHGASGIAARWTEAIERESRQRALALADELERQATVSAPRMYRIPATRRG